VFLCFWSGLRVESGGGGVGGFLGLGWGGGGMQLADSAWFPHMQILLEFWHMLTQSKKFSTSSFTGPTHA